MTKEWTERERATQGFDGDTRIYEERTRRADYAFVPRVQEII